MHSITDIKDFFESLSKLLGSDNRVIDLIGFLITVLFGISWLFYKYLKLRRASKSRADLHPFLEDDEIKKATAYYIQTQCQDRPVEIEEELSDGDGIANKSKAINFFKKEFYNNNRRFYFVLADAGMGKTTFMINLFLDYSKGLFSRKYDIKFIPLNDKDADIHINNLKGNAKNTILLLDALEEDTKITGENWQERINDIIDNVRYFRKVIITCRTQFFPNEESEKFTLEIPKHGGTPSVHRVNKKYISPFTDLEVKKYLNKKYGKSIVLDEQWIYTNPKRIKAKQIVDLAPSLCLRPMLLDKVDELLNTNTKFTQEFQVFEQLVHLWILRESDKQPGRKDEDFYSNMNRFLEIAAETVYKNFRSGDGLFLNEKHLKKIADENSIELSLIDMKAKSLLNRNPKGLIKFSHKTILEYFLAKIDCIRFRDSIDFTTFDFGLLMRDQMLIDKTINNRLNVLIEVGNKFFRSISMYNNVQRVHKIDTIIINNEPTLSDFLHFRVFHNLSKIIIIKLDKLRSQTIRSLSIQSLQPQNVEQIIVDIGKDHPETYAFTSEMKKMYDNVSHRQLKVQIITDP